MKQEPHYFIERTYEWPRLLRLPYVNRQVAKLPGNCASFRPNMNSKSPQSVVQAQLNAYNAKDIDRLLETYAPDAEQFTLHGECLARGRDEMRARFLLRFAEPNLHARLLSRCVVGNVVADFESITRNFPEGLGTIEMLCVYQVEDGRIQKVSFVVGEKRLVTVSCDAT